ncbi:toll-like receptor 8b [Pygocentrus nattereri]|uniref:toll-like receptor 8b n=1 Tax=Pygocentrus nattereri TaxID=42514 RepID=UPI0008143C2D|nr:toll-like receptor 8b [Pygocentrus nattereri]
MLIVVLMSYVYSSYGLIWSWRTLPCDITLSNTSISLDCSCRKLCTVPKISIWNATQLNLAKNQIKKVSSDSFSKLQNLTLLNLKGNRLQNEPHTDKLLFSDLARLKILLLDDNHLSAVPRDVPAGLQALSLSGNHIETIGPSDFARIKNIKDIRLSKNCYQKIGSIQCLIIQNKTFSDLHQLTYLFLAQNRLQMLPPDLPGSLQKLHLRQNTIENIKASDLENLTKLIVLDLSGNCPLCYNAPFPCSPCKTKNNALQIDPEAFSQLSQLQELRLSGNSLQTLNPSWFKNLTALKYLYLSFNFLISEIETGQFFSSLPYVEVIDLSYNNPPQKLSRRLKLSKGFSELKSLKSLHLEGYVFSVLCESDLKPLFSLKNLSVLNLGVNFLQQINLSLFENFYNLSVISLMENTLTLTGMKTNQFERLCTSYVDSEDKEEHSVQSPYIHRDEEFRRYPPFLKPECLATGPVLDLSRNNMYYINPEYLQAVESITCLNLSYNDISSFFNGTEFIQFPKLKYLDLSHNRIYLRLESAFNELKELEVLDLSHNKHYFEVAGVRHTLAFLEHLENLKVLNLSWNEINTLSDKTLNSSSLKELQFQGNRLDIMWKKDSFKNLFKHLGNLTHLDISYNKLRQIPGDILSYFPPTLKYLNLNRNQLSNFCWEQLSYLPQLEILDLSKNKLDVVTEAHIGSLRILDLRHNMISKLAINFLEHAKSLKTLDLSFNRLEIINETSFQLHDGNNLHTLYLKSNPLRCTCDLLDFVLWLETSEIEIPNLATGVLCDLPASKKGQPMIQLDLKNACINDSTARILCIISSAFILIMLFTAITIHLFYWDVSYILTFWKAKIKGHKSTECIYDAFVMYDTKDPLASDWVLNHLRAELEDRGETVRPLCLEERDWMPGSSIMENLNQSIRWSRKTIFVLTEGFVCSGIFKVAAYLTQQRLLEEGVDIMVLILLEPVLQHSRILHLRRCLCGNSVLEWPRNPSSEKWFWQSLRNAIRNENQGMQSKLFKNYYST